MKIIVMSDSHGSFERLYEVFDRNRDADLFIHLGDGEREYEQVQSVFAGMSMRFVRGNNDYSLGIESQVVGFGGYRAYCTHGSRYPRIGREEYLSAAARANDCTLALFGHSHIRHYSFYEGVHLFNPGSVLLPRDQKPPCYGIITVDKIGRIDFLWENV